ncbi:MAG: hypothetical protein AB1571_03965 [Nanoarchaeota archaeon]
MPETEKDILSKYEARLKGSVSLEGAEIKSDKEFSREYVKFREESLSTETTLYERFCNSIERIIQIRPKQEKLEVLTKAIETSHLKISPTGAASFAMFVAVLLVLFAIFLGVFSYLINPDNPSIFFPLILIILAAVSINPLTNIPIYIANRWRLKASNQMVLCILYIVMYMRHTSNLEHAIKFSAEHIGSPLSLDLRKIFWDVETGKYSTIKESLESYLETWRGLNQEFITSLHLVESSLFEPSEERRMQLLDKSIEVMLEGTYEKMLHYAQELKNPITMLHMLGVILPILGLVIFPLIGSFLGGLIKWYHLAILYNIILPIVVFSMGSNMLAKRSTGYGESEIAKSLEVKKPYAIAIFLASIIIILGLFPFILKITDPSFDIDLGRFGKLLDYRNPSGNQCSLGESCSGPYGLGALLLSLFIPLGLAVGFGLYYKIKTKNLIKIRNETKQLEKEFASSLFQLGTRIGDGVPAELAFSTVAKNMEGTPTGNFFRLVSVNIQNLGMSLKEAIFNSRVGAILSYPSSLIQSSMEVLLESSKKGPKIVSQSLISISVYIDRIHTVNERLKDLLSEIVSSMKSQVSFLTPIIAGIVVGIASMIVNIIGNLGLMFQKLTIAQPGSEFGGLSAITSIFKIQDIIPSYFFQAVVGIYVVELVFILTILANGIENGPDKLNQDHELGKNMFRGTFLYVLISFAVIILFNLLASGILAATQL